MLLKSFVNILMQDFDPIRHVLEHVPSEENELTYFEKQVLPLMFLSLAINGKYLFILLYLNVKCSLCSLLIHSFAQIVVSAILIMSLKETYYFLALTVDYIY